MSTGQLLAGLIIPKRVVLTRDSITKKKHHALQSLRKLLKMLKCLLFNFLFSLSQTGFITSSGFSANKQKIFLRLLLKGTTQFLENFLVLFFNSQYTFSERTSISTDCMAPSRDRTQCHCPLKCFTPPPIACSSWNLSPPLKD